MTVFCRTAISEVLIINITEQENELFKAWEKKYSGKNFIRDGVPCPAEYLKAKYKITYVLKEANNFDPDGNDYNRDMRTWIMNDGTCGATWSNIVRWTQAILECGCDYPENVDHFDYPKKISFLNLKKVDGGSQSNPVEIKKFAKADADEILSQLKIYQPDIVVCCGINLVADCLADYVFHYEGVWEHYREAYDDCCWFYTQMLGKKTVVLNSYHPLNLGTRRTNVELFNAISNVALKVLSDV